MENSHILGLNLTQMLLTRFLPAESQSVFPSWLPPYRMAPPMYVYVCQMFGAPPSYSWDCSALDRGTLFQRLSLLVLLPPLLALWWHLWLEHLGLCKGWLAACDLPGSAHLLDVPRCSRREVEAQFPPFPGSRLASGKPTGAWTASSL